MTTTNTHTSSTELHALLLTSQQIEHVRISTTDTVTAIQQALGCRNFDVVNLLDHDIDLFDDDEGLSNGSELNLFLTVIVHALGKPVAIFRQRGRPQHQPRHRRQPQPHPRTAGSHPRSPRHQTGSRTHRPGVPHPCVVDVFRSMF